ncbi:hypothetical protein BJ085DRAFT_31124 [Dimargaris cristalligena]|uniref:Uncharacterized protein n=1 Tax=Dimargaris cristalligena TaxID=215637 RepID=A0A4P9ZV46_9FUNG|nr:hypothetical protein BJ085DRAFT_31124 [Dimargaris cristalligena]|eukprot:RKP37445.1 hypothetical protein BJ085DRAFT_31124 [Dimargaris cristalligena]
MYLTKSTVTLFALASVACILTNASATLPYGLGSVHPQVNYLHRRSVLNSDGTRTLLSRPSTTTIKPYPPVKVGPMNRLLPTRNPGASSRPGLGGLSNKPPMKTTAAAKK